MTLALRMLFLGTHTDRPRGFSQHAAASFDLPAIPGDAAVMKTSFNLYLGRIKF